MEDLQIAFKEARSFPGLTPPNNATLIGKKEINKEREDQDEEEELHKELKEQSRHEAG